jgi:hypothetical protein
LSLGFFGISFWAKCLAQHSLRESFCYKDCFVSVASPWYTKERAISSEIRGFEYLTFSCSKPDWHGFVFPIKLDLIEKKCIKKITQSLIITKTASEFKQLQAWAFEKFEAAGLD